LWATFVIFKNCPKKKNHPMGENSPNLVTLLAPHLLRFPQRVNTEVLRLERSGVKIQTSPQSNYGVAKVSVRRS
jgi:hypothetical protein